MNNTQFKLLIFYFFLLTACTTYQPNGFTGGYSETRLGENIFNVNFRGNGYTSRERVYDFALLRSAELADKYGYNYFIIVDSKDYTSNTAYTTRKTYNTTFDAFGNATTTSYGGETYNISKPSSSNTIVCFTEKPQGKGLIYNAKFIMKSIKSKYGIK